MRAIRSCASRDKRLVDCATEAAEAGGLGRSGKRHDVDIARVLVRRLLAIIRRESARVERRRIGRCVRTTEDGGDSSLSRSKLENMGSVVVNADDCIEAMRGRFERGPPAPAAKDASPCEERDASDG